MRIPVYALILAGSICFCLAYSSPAQNLSGELQKGIDEVVASAYQTASAGFPRKLRAQGASKMLKWQTVDGCLNDAYNSVNWSDLSERIAKLRERTGSLAGEIPAMIESSLTAHALPYEKVFLVKNDEALLPLTNSILKFLPPDSLMDLPVFEKSTGKRIGTFSGVYTYDRSGGLAAANKYRMAIFQYTDLKGSIQTPTSENRLLLDSYGVPWKGAVSQPGFRLLSDKLIK
jgi:beta-glucosidase-like glycosyl hydrolase